MTNWFASPHGDAVLLDLPLLSSSLRFCLTAWKDPPPVSFIVRNWTNVWLGIYHVVRAGSKESETIHEKENYKYNLALKNTIIQLKKKRISRNKLSSDTGSGTL